MMLAMLPDVNVADVVARTPAFRLRPATRAVQRPADARLLVVDRARRHRRRPTGELDRLPAAGRRGDCQRRGDPACEPAARAIRARAPRSRFVSPRTSGRGDARLRFDAVLLGAGDWRMPTEARGAPPRFDRGDRLVLGDIHLTVEAVLGHPRFVRLRVDAAAARWWATLAWLGRPVQYAHLEEPLALWDASTPIAARPVAFEAPSAGFVLDAASVQELATRGMRFATLTHAAGLSSTGDPALDARFPLDEPYEIPLATATLVRRDETGGRAHRRDRHDRRAGARGGRCTRRTRWRARRRGRRARPHRPAYAASHRRRAADRHARAGHQPLRVAARIRRRCPARPRRRLHDACPLSHARVRRLHAVVSCTDARTGCAAYSPIDRAFFRSASMQQTEPFDAGTLDRPFDPRARRTRKPLVGLLIAAAIVAGAAGLVVWQQRHAAPPVVATAPPPPAVPGIAPQPNVAPAVRHPIEAVAPPGRAGNVAVARRERRDASRGPHRPHHGQGVRRSSSSPTTSSAASSRPWTTCPAPRSPPTCGR